MEEKAANGGRRSHDPRLCGGAVAALAAAKEHARSGGSAAAAWKKGKEGRVVAGLVAVVWAEAGGGALSMEEREKGEKGEGRRKEV